MRFLLAEAKKGCLTMISLRSFEKQLKSKSNMKTMENDSQDANRVAFNQGYNDAVLGMIKDHNNRLSFHDAHLRSMAEMFAELEPLPFKYIWDNFILSRIIPIKRLPRINYKPRKTTYKTVKRFSAKRNR